MSFPDRALSWIFPPRASTQTWMFLTFALFVGVAVLVVGLYVGFVLQVQTREAMQQTLVQQAENIAVVIEQADDEAEQQHLVDEVSRLTDVYVTAQLSDAVYAGGSQIVDLEPMLEEDRFEVVPAGRVAFGEHETSANERFLYVVLDRPAADLRLVVGQEEPLLFTLVRQMQFTLIVGMIMALLMALLGSWIAADKVTKPLRTIEQTARTITDGKLSETIRVETRAAEIQDLARSLNRAAASFRDKIEELERLTRLQNEFIGNVSHEVRNPMFAVSGYIEALGSPTMTDEQRKRYVEKGLMNLERLHTLFNDLIEIARLEVREDLIKPSTFNLQKLLEEVAEMLEPKAEEKGLELQVSNRPIHVHADRSRIRQVLTNLIDNAIAYTDEGTVRCRIRRRVDKARIEVVDTGRGIPEEHRKRIFERFYRVESDRARKSGGTGLGLSIVKQIIQAHGEQIHVESTAGRGTRFWFDLPYVKQAKEEEVSA